MKDPIIFWFDYPPKVEKGGFNELSFLWEGAVFYVFSNDLRGERKAAKWESGTFGRARVITLFDKSNRMNVIEQLFVDYPNAIHFANGFDTPIMKEIKPIFFSNGRKALLFTERYAIMGNKFEKLVRRILLKYKYSKLCNEYSPYIKAILPTGIKGVDCFANCGYERSRIYNFLYCPDLVDISSKRDINVHDPIKFLYVGRFFYKTKGTDVLMKATKLIKGKWSLDMVGGYGVDSTEVRKQIEKNDNISFLGIWNSEDVIPNMQEYDVVIVPSKADGWNLLINEALHAGVCVISSNEAVSHEVIEKCGAGAIFESGNHIELAKCMQSAIDNHALVQSWIKRGRGVAQMISQQRIGRYLYDIINYEFYGEGARPECPWL